MSQFKFAASLLMSALLLPSVTIAQVSLKGETLSTPCCAPHNWTGFYAGLNAGAVNHTMNITDNDATSFNATIQQISNPQFTGGFQVGYRHQLDLIRASGVYGLEFSANFSDASFSQDYGSPFALYHISAQNSLKDLLLLQLIGGIAADRTLLFLAAGLSWTNITGNVINLDSVAFFDSFNVNKKAIGTALGGGIEYAFTETISARIKADVVTSNTYTVHNNTNNSYQVSNSSVQGTFGINYRFG